MDSASIVNTGTGNAEQVSSPQMQKPPARERGYRKREHVVSAKLTVDEKQRLIEMTNNIDIPCAVIVRQLIRYLLNGYIQWLELIEKTNIPEMTLPEDKSKIEPLRTNLPFELYTTFMKFVEQRDGSPTKTVRRLVLLYLHENIETKEIWKPLQHDTPD